MSLTIVASGQLRLLLANCLLLTTCNSSYANACLLTDFLISTVNLPKATLSFKVTSNLGPTHSQTSTVVHLHRSIDYIHTTNDPTQSTLIEETNPTNIPTAAILGVALGILIIAMLLAVIGIMIACKKAGSSGIDDGRLHQMHITHGSNQSRVKGTVHTVCTHTLCM